MNMPDAYAYWIVGREQSEIRPVALPACGADDVRVRTLYSGISRGTETLVFRGDVPVSEHVRMRAPFQEGAFPVPVKYGYTSVGRVEEGVEALRGRVVFCFYPHQTQYVVPAAAVCPLPENVPPSRAILAANLETAINGVWDAGVHIGDRVAVVGAGTVGCLAAWLVRRMPGCAVELVDIDPRKAAIAALLGVSFALPERAQRQVDLVIHASGAPAGLHTALELAAFEATVLELSWFGTHSVPLPLGESFHAQRLTLRSSQVGTVAAAQRGRWTPQRRLRLALSLLDEAVLDKLITHEDRFEDLPQVMARLAAGETGGLCHRIRYY